MKYPLPFRYCKLLIQEFALRIEQGLIVAILAFFKEEKVCFEYFPIEMIFISLLLEFRDTFNQYA